MREEKKSVRHFLALIPNKKFKERRRDLVRERFIKNNQKNDRKGNLHRLYGYYICTLVWLNREKARFVNYIKCEKPINPA